MPKEVPFVIPGHLLVNREHETASWLQHLNLVMTIFCLKNLPGSDLDDLHVTLLLCDRHPILWRRAGSRLHKIV